MTSGSDAERFDLVVIGSGPAGEKGAALAAYHGKRVALVERSPSLGGTTVATGGIPTKALRETALRVRAGRADDALTVTLDLPAAFRRLRAHATAASAAMGSAVSENLDRLGVEVVPGRARLEAGGRVVRVSGEGRADRALEGEAVLLATGSRPLRPPGIPFDGASVVDAGEILALDRPFGCVVIAGAGAVGSEFASIFAAVGVEVHLVEAGERFLPLLDGEVAALLAEDLRAAGVDLALATTVAEVEQRAGGLEVRLSDGRVVPCDRLLVAAGRVPNTEGLGLEEAGVAVDARGHVVVDDRYRTTVPHVLAAGDVVGPPALASTSMEQARVALAHAFGFPLRRAVDDLLPVGIYTIPEAAGVGMTEETAAAAGIDFEVGRAWFRRNTKAVVARDTDGLVKLVFERATGRLLGAHVLGAEAAELVHLPQAVIHHGGGIGEFVDTTFNVPTRSDAFKYAAYDGIKRAEVRSAFAP
ncbi:MAG TPA: FAD-dependent oxidoreductase [Acidimicrobiales bacterium]|nr:FAD-dependent oxidoreductase [Acidimicrobiales bacterium]